MRVAFIVTMFPRISETFILTQIVGLLDRGHEVQIFAEVAGDDPRELTGGTSHELLELTRYTGHLARGMPRGKILRVLKCMRLFLRAFPRSPRVVLRSLDIFSFGFEALSLSLFYRVLPFLGLKSCDVVHCHFGPNGNLASLLKDSGVFGGKLVVAFHGYDMSSYVRTHGDGVYENLFRAADLCLPVSCHWRDALVSMGCPPEKVLVHRMGIDPRAHEASRVERLRPGKRLLTVARLVEKKGVEYGIRAVAQVVRRHPDLRYDIVGDGPLMGRLASLVEELELAETVRFLGWRDQHDVHKLMTLSDILIAPSVTGEDGDQEGIPVVLMEAMSLGLPVVSTYHSGIPELVEDGKSGFLVDEGDVRGLGERIGFLLDQPDIGLDMGRRGRDFVERNHDSNALNDRLVDIFECLIRNSPVPPMVAGP